MTMKSSRLYGWLLFIWIPATFAQQGDNTYRSTNSVDIQICVTTAFLTPQRDLFQQSLYTYLTTSVLNSNALYLDRQYTTSQGNLCYLYVFQAPNPSMAIVAMQQITAKQSTLSIPLGTQEISCQVSAAQWTGENLSYLGVPFPDLWTVNDLILWGSCLVSVLFLCLSGICCFAMCRLYYHMPPKSKNNNNNKDLHKVLKIDTSKVGNKPASSLNLRLNEKIGA